MAEANILGLSCSICLDLLKDPVTLLCGHSFCMKCINDCWDQEDQKGVYSCPQCRQAFTPRPAVSKNIALDEVVETLKKAGFHATPPAQCSSGPEDVECDFCTERKHKAIKSCLVCLASFCETHLQPHYKSPAFKKHKLVEASRRLQEQICSQHDKLLEVYCRTDQKCICMLCMLDEHKGHDTVSAAAGRAEKQKQLLKIQGKFKQRIQGREKELQELRKAVETHKSSAQTAVQETERIFTSVIQSLERRCSELKDLIRAQEKAAVSRADDVIKQLEQEIAVLKMEDSKIKDLSYTEDPIHFLQRFQSVLEPPKSVSLPTICSHLTYGDVVKSMSYLREKVEECSKEEFWKILDEVSYVCIFPPTGLHRREDFLKYSCLLTLDPNTANRLLCLSEKNTLAVCSTATQSYPDHAERFEHHLQVLCRESVYPRCYWEVEWSGVDGVSIAVSYKNISRKGEGNECVFGCNNQSWRLFCSPSELIFCHNNRKAIIRNKASSFRIGVYVDYKEGSLSFYSVSDEMKLLYRFYTKFTQPLYPGFMVWLGSRVKLCCLQ
ncbi:E3 ubiquitin/ISG15 ligase TRIM25-like [Clarias gariepinus]|uniref:E3 ubiquitin/ISG15 ligase TRIM25-like n=1 Tax=Clarias gariepinus TaxID=13013 RepID=UPI00234D5314|nr:E3 ubiquitin/ISG15 ligase TRIM25-like [Clarias gariepinus]